MMYIPVDALDRGVTYAMVFLLFLILGPILFYLEILKGPHDDDE